MTVMTEDKKTGTIEVIPNVQSIHCANGQMIIIKKEVK